MRFINSSPTYLYYNRYFIRVNKKNLPFPGGFFYNHSDYLFLIAACAAASLAIGTRKGEQET